MRRIFGLTMILASGCLAVPELIIDEPPLVTDAGNVADAGAIEWSILPASGSLFGASADINSDAVGFQIELSVQGLADTEFGVYDGETLLAAGRTNAQGIASLEMPLDHGAHELTFRAQDHDLNYLLNIDLVGPTLELDAQAEPARLPWLVWSNESDADGVGSDEVASLELRINDGDFEPIADRLGDDGGGRLRGLNPGLHQLIVRATDELGNTTQIERTVTVALQMYSSAHDDNHPLSGKPCVGNVDADSTADLAIIRSLRLGSISVNIGSVLMGEEALGEGAARTFPIGGQGAVSCLFAPLLDDGYDELAIATLGDRSAGRFDFVNWPNDAQTGRTFHVLAEPEEPSGVARLNMAFLPNILINPSLDDGLADALILQTGDVFLRLYNPSRFNEESPSSIGGFAADNIVVHVENTMPSTSILTLGMFRNGERENPSYGVAVVDPDAADGHGAVWLLDRPFTMNQSYSFRDEPGDGAMQQVIVGQADREVGDYPVTVRLNPGETDGILTTHSSRRGLIVHRIGSPAEILETPEDLGLIRDLAACDLNGDGRDEISIAGAINHHIRWGDGEWTTSNVSDRPKFTLCTGDMNGDEVEDLVVTTLDARQSVHVLH